ncbi:MAG: PD-(D/E)XK nuclease family protein [Myxococcota bacterium]
MSGVERVLEIASSTRVLRERRLRALDGAPGRALLGAEFLNLRAMAERCAAETGVRYQVSLGATELERLVAVCCERSSRFGPLVAERPGLAAALAGTLRDLRDAGVPPERLPSDVSALRSLYTDVEQALSRLADEGRLDRIGLFRLAVRGAAKYVTRRGFTRAEVHGAVELVGSAGDLVDAVAAALPAGAVRFFQPDWGDEHAARVRAEWSWPRFPPEPVEVVDEPAFTRDGPIPEGRLRVLRARSPRDELELVAREVLALLERGVAPHEIAIVARSLEPYAPWLPAIFEGYGIPVTSSLSDPAVSGLEARTWLELVRMLASDLERRHVLGFLDAIAPRAVARLAERVAREAAVVRGEADWREALDAAANDPDFPELSSELRFIFDARRDFAEAASFFDAVDVAKRLGCLLGPDVLTGSADAALDRGSRFDELDRAAEASRPVAPATVATALESLLLELADPWQPADEGGVRILDAIQARALPCAHLFLIGTAHGAWPRPSTEDPFLVDAVREALRAGCGRPVPVRGWALAEERFLLGLLLSQASEQVTLSYADADGSGRALSPSGFLRDLPFVERGSDVVALATRPDGAAPPFARAAAPLGDAARDFIAQTDAFRSESLPFDGDVGSAALRLPERLSPSFVAELGVCPLRAFFKSVLGARELVDPSPDTLDANEAGQLAHDALRSLYQRLFEEGRLAPGTDPAAAIARADALLASALDEAAKRARPRVRTREPGVWAAFLEVVGRALGDFVRRDLETLLPAGVAALDVERDLEARIELGGGIGLELEGRIDRIVQRPDGGLRVGDYKTSRNFAKPVEAPRVRRGTSLQVPLYALAVASAQNTHDVVGEALPVPVRPERDRDRDRDTERSLELAEIETLALPVLGELAGLLERGAFPFHADPDECRYCPYTIACRREHGPSRERIAAANVFAPWLALRGRVET